MKKTLVLGAGPRPDRFSHKAAVALHRAGHPIVPVGIHSGEVAGQAILHGQPAIEHVDTVTLYLNPARQREYYDYILSLQPKRILFNPGTENHELEELAAKHGIECVEGCTLVMLALRMY
jgi:predicted CoA-binding protein